MSEYEDTKVNNALAHLSQLKGELLVISSDLAKVLKEKEQAEASLVATRIRITTEQKEFESYGLHAKMSLDEREARIADEEHTLKQERVDFEEYRTKELHIIKSQRSLLDESIITKREKLAALTTAVETTEAHLVDLDAKMKASEKSLSALLIQIHETTKQVAEAAEFGAKNEKETQRSIGAKKEELKEIERQIQEGQEKIKFPMENLKKREEEVARKELNLTILRSRFAERWKKLYPNQPVNID